MGPRAADRQLGITSLDRPGFSGSSVAGSPGRDGWNTRGLPARASCSTHCHDLDMLVRRFSFAGMRPAAQGAVQKDLDHGDRLAQPPIRIVRSPVPTPSWRHRAAQGRCSHWPWRRRHIATTSSTATIPRILCASTAGERRPSRTTSGTTRTPTPTWWSIRLAWEFSTRRRWMTGTGLAQLRTGSPTPSWIPPPAYRWTSRPSA